MAQQLQRSIGRGQRDKSHHGFGRSREKAEIGGGDHAQRAFRADKNLLHIIAGIVFGKRPEHLHHLAIGQHHFQARHQRSHHAVAQDMVAAGIGGDGAAAGAGAFGCEREREHQSGLRGGLLCFCQNHARFGGQNHAALVQSTDAVHALHGQQHFAMKRNLAAHQPGIAALGHDGYSRLKTDAHDGCNLRGCGGLQHQGRASLIFAAPFFQMGGNVLRVFGEAFFTHGFFETGNRVTHGAVRGAAARRRRSLIASPRPVSGMGETAMAALSLSSSRSMANRLAAASFRSPRGLRLRRASRTAPNPNKASPGRGWSAFRRSRAWGA